MFPMWILNMFPSSQCVPQNVPNSITFYHIFFAQRWTFTTIKAGLQGKHLYTSIWELRNVSKFLGKERSIWSLRCLLLYALHIVKDVVVVFCEAFFITWPVHPSIHLILHPWMALYSEKTLAEINNPPPPTFCACVTVEERHARPQGGAPPRFWYQYQQQTQHIF